VNRIKWIGIAAAMWLAILAAGNIGLRRTEQALALSCARASSGTDQAIVDCYHTYGLIAKDLE
jgi:hypothetical protein